MPCQQCTREFSLFHREAACPNCGFGHCSSCLKHKVSIKQVVQQLGHPLLQVKVPKLWRECRVCPPCHALLTAVRPLAPPSPPRALQQRLDALPVQGAPRGLGAEDRRIADRLERLHQVGAGRDEEGGRNLVTRF